ncbi:MAG TPA: hypothetical protein EYQ73_03530 [Candidatus Poseidoniales archaeon]|nr:MAG: hypothetical protein CXT71_01590 [Euryarchaeota archaeon]HIF45851.1 hypothetical protein [Candidatus Poseidoniales archaeon]HIL64569.1 hypothetical protein [Candidatus Poseidoniales archaeon]
MATYRQGVQAFALVLILLFSGPVSQVLSHAQTERLDSENGVDYTPAGQRTRLVVPGAGMISSQVSLEVTAGNAIQELDLTIEADARIRNTGFYWDDWTQTGFVSTGLAEDAVDDALILGFQGVDWNFDKGTEGWTSSNSGYGYRNTGTACGMANSAGGSMQTRGGSVSITSPTVNLNGHSGLVLTAWLKQGTYNCGEEPDINEDFTLEYKSSSGSWSRISYLYGSSAGGTVTNVNFTLPSDAYHSLFQVRGRQTGGSGTCCDYWYFDDIRIPSTSGSNLTTRSIGWSSNSDEQIEPGPFLPVFIEAELPYLSSLNWTVIDDVTNVPIPGLIDQSGKIIDLSIIDWQTTTSVRFELAFKANQQGDSPRLYGISGGGKFYDSLQGYPVEYGWETNNSGWNSGGDWVSGSGDSTFISPIYRLGTPIAAYRFESILSGNVTIELSIDGGPWQFTNASTGFTQLTNPINSFQIKYHGNVPGWLLESFELELYPALVVLQPEIDIDNDGFSEWSVSNNAVGSWGNQDVFHNGSRNYLFINAAPQTKWIQLLIPQNASHFKVSATKVALVGQGVQTIALWIGNTMVAQTGGNESVKRLVLDLNETEVQALSNELSNSNSALRIGGQDFISAKVEIIADQGSYELSGLSIPYLAQEQIQATALHPIVMGANMILKESISGNLVPLPVSAQSKAGLAITINSISSSGDVDVGVISLTNDSNTLTPSQKWRTLSLRTQSQLSSLNMFILDLNADGETAQWLIPINGGNMVELGIHDVLIFDGAGVSVNTTGNIDELSITFRTSQAWDDVENLRISGRVQLANGVVSLPSNLFWTNPAVSNDLTINNVDWFSDGFPIANNRKYLKSSGNISMEVEIGFQYGAAGEHPYPGEFLLELHRDGVFIANTTELTSSVWRVETVTPFTSGNVTWQFTIAPLAGGGVADPWIVNRTFIIDPLAPVVIGSNIRHYDHLTPSAYQQIIVNITDQPVLPTNVKLMLWREWLNDLNGDSWPNEGEYIETALSLPSDLNGTYGSYVAYVDDAAGFQGEKVAGYVIGVDLGGHDLLEGGSVTEDDHLFMYQLMPDGPPVVDTDGFEWMNGKKAWLHPGQNYQLNISFSEANGISDVGTIEVALADNIASDRMAITWNQSNHRCESSSIHLNVKSCQILTDEGTVPNAYDRDLIMVIELNLKWSTPDLGDTRREPSIKVTDRADHHDLVNYPQNRWRFSAEMMILDNVSLWVENGALTDEGARVSPGTAIELSGIVVFEKSGELPDFDCDVEVRLNGIKGTATAAGGLFTAATIAPIESGRYPFTWNVDCLVLQGIDVTDETKAVAWIIVDDIGPVVIEFLSPRQSSILEPGQHDIKVVVSEPFGIDVNSVELIWWITPLGQNDAIMTGTTDLSLEGDLISGLRLLFEGQINFSSLNSELLQEQLVIKMRLEGRDLAGNQFETFGNSENHPAGKWDLIQHIPDFSIDSGGVELSKLNLEVDEATAVHIYLRNSGLLAGETSILIEVVKLDGSRETLARPIVEIDAESVATVVVDWKPETPGIQWIEVSLNEEFEQSRMIDVKPPTDDGFMSGIFGKANPWLVGIALTMLGITLLLVLTWLRMATVRAGSSGEEIIYEEEFEDEYED